MKPPRKVLLEVSTQEVPPEGFTPWASPSLPGGAAGVRVGGFLQPHTLGVPLRALLWAELPSGATPLPSSSQGTPRTCGFFLGRPRPLFSNMSFSPLEARGWLDLAPDSLIVLPAAVRRSGKGRKVSQ